jgi:predicted transcriptional regulator
MTTTLGVKLDQETRNRLKALAETKQRATHWVIKTALLEYLDKEEANLRERLEDQERWERYQLTGQAVPNEQVVKWLDALAAGDRQPWPR